MAIRKLVSGFSVKAKRLKSLRQTFRTGRRVNGDLSAAHANRVIDHKSGKIKVGVPAHRARELRLADGGDTRKAILTPGDHRMGEPAAPKLPKSKSTSLSGKKKVSSASGGFMSRLSKLWTREPDSEDMGDLIPGDPIKPGQPMKTGRREYNRR